jgi:tetratricopeptide (TPR) repeat protein
LARTYQALGRGKDAVVQAQAAFDLFAGNADVSPTAMQAAERTLAELAIDNGQYASASETLTALRDRQRATLGADAVDTLMTTAALARALNELNEFSRAETLLRQDLPAAQRAPAESWRLVIELQRQLVRALVVRSHAYDAEPLCRSMLASLEQHAGPVHPDRIGVLSMLANVLSAVGRHAEATEAFKDALALSRTVFGGRHPATARTLVAHSAFLTRSNRRVEARAAADEALSIFRDALGPDHPLALSALWHIAVMTLNEGHGREAEPLLRQVAAARRRSLGPTHPMSIAALDTLGIVLLNQGRESEARATQREVLALYEQAVAPENADPLTIVAFIQYLMTVRPDDLQNPAYARRIAERAVTATQRRDYAELVLLAELEFRNGNNDKVMPLLREALALPEARFRRNAERDAVEFLEQTATPVEVESFLRQRLQDERMPPTASEEVRAATLRLLGLHLQKQQKLDEAERCLTEALELQRHVFPADDWVIGDAQSELGGCIAARRDFARAEALLLEGFRLIEGQAVRARKTSLPDARKRLVALYEAWGRADEAQRWRAETNR